MTNDKTMNKADFKDWVNRKYGETIDIPYFQTLPFKDINQFAEDFAEKERESILFEFIDWFDKYVAPYGKRRHVKKFLHFYNQKFKDENI